METTGNVDCAGGIVAKSVGPTGTTVVALPVTSVLHEATSNTRLKMAAEAETAVRLIEFMWLNRRRNRAQRMLTKGDERYKSGRDEAKIGDGNEVEPIKY